MTLAEDAKRTMDGFDAAPSDEIIKILERIIPSMKSPMTRKYLAGKISGARSAGSEDEKKALCKNLRPYLDWAIQGG